MTRSGSSKRPGGPAARLGDFGLVALPALCCLLGALVYTALAASEPRPTDEKRPPDAVGPLVEHLKALEAEIAAAEVERDALRRRVAAEEQAADEQARARSRLEALKKALTEVEARIAALRNEQAELEKKVAAERLRLAQADALRKELERLTEDADRLRNNIKDLQAVLKQLKDRESLFGTYHGPHILLECVGGAAILYPGKKRIAVDASQAELDVLIAQAEKKGFVLLLARPSGFEGSFPKFLGLVRNQIEEKGKKIGLSFIPIEEAEAIEKYLPEGDD